MKCTGTAKYVPCSAVRAKGPDESQTLGCIGRVHTLSNVIGHDPTPSRFVSREGLGNRKLRSQIFV